MKEVVQETAKEAIVEAAKKIYTSSINNVFNNL
jgi:hypothetical protein